MAFTIKQNDRRPVFVVNLKDDFGEDTEAAVNLTNATSASFSMREAAVGGTVKINKAAGTITNAAAGEVTYNWTTTDTNTVGQYQAEVEIIWSDTKPETFPNDSYWDVEVVDDIA